MTAPDVLREVAQRLAKDIGAVASLVRERGYGTERDKSAMLARLDGWQTAALDIADALAAASAPVPAGTCATCQFHINNGFIYRGCTKGVSVNAQNAALRQDFGCTLHEPAAPVRGTQE